MGQYWQSTNLNDKDKNYKTGKTDIGELAYSLLPQDELQFAGMIYDGSQIANALGDSIVVENVAPIFKMFIGNIIGP